MKILLIGGTGTISTQISHQLALQGHDLWLLNRGNRSDKIPANAKILQGDIQDENAVQNLLKGHFFDVVAQFIAYTPKEVERDWRIFNDKTNQYIFISSASAYQKPVSHYPITESTPLANPYWEYSQQKIACEERLTQLYRETGFPVTIVRPSHTYDVGKVPVGIYGNKGSWQVLQRLLDGKPVLVHGDGTSLWTFTHARDFAKGFIGLMANPHAIGQSVHITSDESVTWNQAYATIARALNVKLRLVHIPSQFLAASGIYFGYDFSGNLLGDKSNTVIFDNSKLKSLVPNFAATTRYDQGVTESVQYLMEHPELQIPDPDFDSYCDRVIGAMDGALQNLAGNI